MFTETTRASHYNQDIQRLVKLKSFIHVSFSMSWLKTNLLDAIGTEVVVVVGAAVVALVLEPAI